jgi:hypothetical protein
MHITLELSGLANWMQNADPPLDPYDPINYPRKVVIKYFFTQNNGSLGYISRFCDFESQSVQWYRV